jgi:hypothetical protein
LRNEAPAGLGLSGFIKSHNITDGAIMNAISAASVRASDFETAFRVKLCALIWRQPIPEKTTRARFRPIFFDEASIECAQGVQARPGAARAAASEQKHLPRREVV